MHNPLSINYIYSLEYICIYTMLLIIVPTVPNDFQFLGMLSLNGIDDLFLEIEWDSWDKINK